MASQDLYQSLNSPLLVDTKFSLVQLQLRKGGSARVQNQPDDQL